MLYYNDNLDTNVGHFSKKSRKFKKTSQRIFFVLAPLCIIAFLIYKIASSSKKIELEIQKKNKTKETFYGILEDMNVIKDNIHKEKTELEERNKEFEQQKHKEEELINENEKLSQEVLEKENYLEELQESASKKENAMEQYKATKAKMKKLRSKVRRSLSKVKELRDKYRLINEKYKELYHI